MRNISPQKQGGGLYHALIGTIDKGSSRPHSRCRSGSLTAIYLVEYSNKAQAGQTISFFVDVMTGIPSIIAGLFIYTFWVLTLGFQRSGFAGSLALTILMIPVIVRSTEEMLKSSQRTPGGVLRSGSRSGRRSADRAAHRHRWHHHRRHARGGACCR